MLFTFGGGLVVVVVVVVVVVISLVPCGLLLPELASWVDPPLEMTADENDEPVPDGASFETVLAIALAALLLPPV